MLSSTASAICSQPFHSCICTRVPPFPVCVPPILPTLPLLQVVASLLEELASRGGLGAALGQRDPASLLPLLDHIRRHVGDPRYAPLLSAVAHRLLDAYSGVVGRDSQVRT